MATTKQDFLQLTSTFFNWPILRLVAELPVKIISWLEFLFIVGESKIEGLKKAQNIHKQA